MPDYPTYIDLIVIIFSFVRLLQILINLSNNSLYDLYFIFDSNIYKNPYKDKLLTNQIMQLKKRVWRYDFGENIKKGTVVDAH